MIGFSMHSQAVWESKSADQRLPAWLRVACLAYGTHRKNGHANLQPGDLKLILARIDTATGELIPNENVSRAIDTAVTNGWLAEGSRTTCLRVPAHAIWGGSSGTESAPCLVCK